MVAGVFWRFIFDTHQGIINGILIGLGIIHDPINWLQDGTNSVIIAVIATAWRSIPLLTLLLLAALKTIPGAHYRAARMDGATSWETFRFVVLPAIRPTVMVIAVLGLRATNELLMPIWIVSTGTLNSFSPFTDR